MPRTRLLAWTLSGCFALLIPGACKKAPEQPPEGARATKQGAPKAGIPKLSAEERKIVLAEVNGKPITKGEFHDRIHRQSVFNRRRYTSLERKKQFLDREFILPLLEYEEAQRTGLQKDAYVQRTLKNLMVSKLMRKLRTEFKTAEPSEADLRAFYQKHQDDYNQPELVRASHILVKTKAEAQRIAAEVKGKSRVEFRKLVQKYSLDQSTKTRAGDLRYFDRQGKVRRMARVAPATVPKAIVDALWPIKKPGTVVGPVQTKQGWHVLYFTGRRPAHKRPFDKARLHVKKRVQRERWQDKKRAFLEKLKKQLGAKLPPEAELKKRLELVKVDLSAPAFPHGHPGMGPGHFLRRGRGRGRMGGRHPVGPMGHGMNRGGH